MLDFSGITGNASEPLIIMRDLGSSIGSDLGLANVDAMTSSSRSACRSNKERFCAAIPLDL